MALTLEHIHKYFEKLKVIEDISLQVDEPEIVVIVGPSGCGKSTLLNIVGGIIHADGGKANNTYQRIGYVFQEDRLLPWRTVKENIQLVNDHFSEKALDELLRALEILDFKNAKPDELSGGMRQRVAIARAFAYGPDLLLMDEPLKSLDLQLRFNVLEVLRTVWQRYKCAILYVTHEIDEALMLGDRILVLGKRPSTVSREIRIEIPKEKRQFGSKELDAYRETIIGELFSN